MFPTMTLIAAASLIALSTAQGQTGERALLNPAPATAPALRFSVFDPGRLAEVPGFAWNGERALLGRVDHAAEPNGYGDVQDTPVDGTRALLGRSIALSPTVDRSTFVATLRGSAGGEASGDAEFGSVHNAVTAAPFVLSLGARSDQSAILFTRRSGEPLGVGRYIISEQDDEDGEILALVTTGSVSQPTGVFHGRSGWLVVTEASGSRLEGRFQVEAVGFLAAAPEVEDRAMIATGSFSALAAQ